MSRGSYIRLSADIGASDHAIALEEESYLAGIGLYVMILGFCHRQLTDGAVPRRAMSRAIAPGVDTDAIVQELVRVGLLEPCDSGWTVPHYLDWQQSRAEVEANIEQRREAGRRSAEAREAKRAAKPLGQEQSDQAIKQTSKQAPLESRCDEPQHESPNESLNGSLDTTTRTPAWEEFDSE